MSPLFFVYQKCSSTGTARPSVGRDAARQLSRYDVRPSENYEKPGIPPETLGIPGETPAEIPGIRATRAGTPATLAIRGESRAGILVIREIPDGNLGGIPEIPGTVFGIPGIRGEDGGRSRARGRGITGSRMTSRREKGSTPLRLTTTFKTLHRRTQRKGRPTLL